MAGSDSEHATPTKSPTTAAAAPLFKRACDACRARKVRCDKGSPCSACKASEIPCYTSPPEARPKRKRVHVSEEYEKKIDQIQSRLAGLDHVLHPGPDAALRTPTSSAASPAGRNALSDSKPKEYASPFATHEAIEEDNEAFEGETSLFAHSVQARQLLERVVRANPMAATNPEMANALSSLRKLVAIPETHYGTRRPGLKVPNAGNGERIDLGKLILPPINAVLEVLRRAKVVPTLTCSYPIPFLRLEQLTDLCKSVFFNVESYPTSTAVLVHGNLYYLFDEFAWIAETPEEKAVLKQHAALCRKNLDISLNNFDVLLSATYDNVIALMLGACYATEISKANMCWKLTSTAANLAQQLGWHRASSMNDDTPQQRRAKQTVFWFIYIIDRALALRLGRASVLQDYDIDIELPQMDDTVYGPLASKVFHLWVQCARIQGLVYEQLYSPRALKEEESSRTEKAYKLLDELQIVRNNYDSVEQEYRDGKFKIPERSDGTFKVDVGVKLLFLSDTVLQYVLLTTIHRAIPPADGSGISSACLDAARQALHLHQAAAELHKNEPDDIWSIYVHWTVLHSPFTPFIIVFLNILRTSNASDLSLLDRFVRSLADNHFSHGVRRMHQLCTIFYQIAKLYVETSQMPSQQHVAGTTTNTSQSSHLQPPQQLNAQIQYRATPTTMPSPSTPNHYPSIPTPSSTHNLQAVTNAAHSVEQAQGQHWGPINPYLNALGFAGDPMLDGNAVMNPSLGDWFSGNQYIMGLLDEDLGGWDQGAEIG